MGLDGDRAAKHDGGMGKNLKACCWMFGIPVLACGGLLTPIAINLYGALDVGGEPYIAAGSYLAESEKDLRDAELDVRVAYSEQLSFRQSNKSEQERRDLVERTFAALSVAPPYAESWARMGKERLLDTLTLKGKLAQIDREHRAPVKILAISADRRIAEVEVQTPDRWRGFTFFERLSRF